jgi:NitT/TauT family transport system substrate-binding protein
MIRFGLLIAWMLAAGAAQAQDKVKMGLFISSSAMPYFIAVDRGYFKAENLDVEGVPLATHPLIIQGMVTGDLDTASNLLSPGHDQLLLHQLP